MKNLELFFEDITVDNDEFEDIVTLEEDKDEDCWKKERVGKITGSNFAKLVVTDKKGGHRLSDSKVAKDLIYKIAWERLLLDGNLADGLNRLNISSKATQHGNDYEGQAILRYMEETGLDVVTNQRYKQYDDQIGGTPDGYIGKEGLIEVKCPYNGGNHLQTFLKGEIYNREHIYQVQGYLMITGRKWCDFVTYDPDMPRGLDISITRIERDEKIIKGIQCVLNEVKEKLKEIEEEIQCK